MERQYPMNDEELWRRASDGDAAAEDELIGKFATLVKVCARPYFLAGGDSEDLIQEGMLGLLSAVRQYDPAKDTAFRTFAEHCIRNRLYTAIKSAARNKHTPLNDYVSFESPQFDESQTMTPSRLRNPEELIITRERTEELLSSLDIALSGFESKVLALYLEGMSYLDIASQLEKTPKSIDNAVQRIRKKLAQYL